MAKTFYPDFFNDVFGPVMQPGSSGGFAAPSRIGYAARSLIHGEPTAARFIFSTNDSGLASAVNFMTDRAYLGGIQGFLPDDIRLFDAHELAREKHISYSFETTNHENRYEGSIRIELSDAEGNQGTMIAASVGGGMIRVYEAEGFLIDWEGDTYGALLIWPAGENAQALYSISDALTEALGENLVETKRLSGRNGDIGLFAELSEDVPIRQFLSALNQSISISNGYISDANNSVPLPKIIKLPALLPVVTKKGKQPQLFTTVAEWRKIAEDRGISFVQAAIEYEKRASLWSEAEIWEYFSELADILDAQIHSLERVGYDAAQDTPLLPVYGKLWDRYEKSGRRASDDLTAHIITHALSVNAKLPGWKIVPGPMGTGGGYLYSALSAVAEKIGASRQKVLESLVVAAALGALAFTHTHTSGRVGCVGESGVCCAMASGAVAWLLEGDGKQVENAASMALQANLGIPCDPISGGLEFPCITRTVRAAVTAPLYAELAVAGIDPLVPYHELLQVIEQGYRERPKDFLCGDLCGCNLTDTARICRERLSHNSLDILKYDGA